MAAAAAAVSRFPGVALVTGAASGKAPSLNMTILLTPLGIGAAVANALARAGCTRLILADYNEPGLHTTTDSIRSLLPPSSKILPLHGNIAKPDFVTSLFSTIRADFGRLDYAVNCAGVLGDGKRSTETTLEQFDRVNSINYRGLWLCSRAELAMMKEQELVPYAGSSDLRLAQLRGQRGAIVNIASQLGIVSRPSAPSYCASKAAVISLTKSDAIDYSADRIRVNAVCPGVIATNMTTATKELEEMLAPAVMIAPMKRMGVPEEVADAVVWLLSGEASFVQGEALVVDGGYVIS